MSRLQEKYQNTIVPKLKQELKKTNSLAVPKILKVVINIGIGQAGKDENTLKKISDYLTALSGQKPAVRCAKKSIAEFKIREGMPVGLVATLRGKRMYDFLDKLFSIVLPRVRDFRGLSRKGFDSKGNYTLSLVEQIIFPEVDYDKIDKIRGMEITIVTNAQDKKKAKMLLEELGMPFSKEGE
jgi:large subunit ribosomal protein L5